MRLMISKPSPLPSPETLVVKNGSKILCRICSGMPPPLSAMRIWAVVSSAVVVIVMVVMILPRRVTARDHVLRDLVAGVGDVAGLLALDEDGLPWRQLPLQVAGQREAGVEGQHQLFVPLAGLEQSLGLARLQLAEDHVAGVGLGVLDAEDVLARLGDARADREGLHLVGSLGD